LKLAEHVAEKQEKLIVRQQAQLHIRCVHMEVLSRDVTDAQIGLTVASAGGRQERKIADVFSEFFFNVMQYRYVPHGYGHHAGCG